MITINIPAALYTENIHVHGTCHGTIMATGQSATVNTLYSIDSETDAYCDYYDKNNEHAMLYQIVVLIIHKFQEVGTNP
jgi:hypothetical protein